VYSQYPKVPRHACPVIGPHYYSSTQKRFILGLQLLTVKPVTYVACVCHIFLI